MEQAIYEPLLRSSLTAVAISNSIEGENWHPQEVVNGSRVKPATNGVFQNDQMRNDVASGTVLTLHQI